MIKRMLIYCLIGLISGVADWYYLDLLANFPWGPLSDEVIMVPVVILLNFGIWILPVVATAVYEIRHSKSVRLSALSGIATWISAIFGYYTFYTMLLSFWGLPHMENMLLFKEQNATFWQDWLGSFQQVILYQFLEWISVAVVGGGLLGYTIGKLSLSMMNKQKEI
jgi:hypothetical protein